MVLDTLAAVRDRLLSSGGVLADTIQSGVWMGATTVTSRAFELTRLIALTVLLSPEEFGVMGIALLTIASFEMLTELGIKDALIYNENEDVDEYLDTAWIMNTARGLAIFAIVFVLAPYISDFFSEPRATPVVRTIALMPLLFGLQNPAIVYFEKDLNFHQYFLHQVSGSFIGAVTAIGFAIEYGTVWALVVGYLASRFSELVVSYLLTTRRPGLGFELSKAIELFGYGKWLTGLSFFVFLGTQGDDAFLGWFLGASALGVYQVAYQISNAPATEVGLLVSKVVFPAYSKVQDDIAQIRSGFLSVLVVVSLVTFPMTVGTIAVAPTFVLGVMGEQWADAVQPIQVLALWGLLRAMGSITGPMFKAVGRPDVLTKLAFGKTVLIAALIYPLTAEFGIVGTALAVLVSSAFFSEPIKYYLALQQSRTTWHQLFKRMFVPLVASLIMGFGVVFARERVPLSAGLLKLLLLVLLGVGLYLTAVVLLERQFDYGLRSLVQTVRSSMA